MDLWRIAVRALVAYAYLLLTTRAGGKRVVSQATPFDLVVAILVGDLIDDVLWAEVSVPKFGAAAASIFFCDAIVKIGVHRSAAFLRLVNGAPTEVVRDGKEDRGALRSEQLSEVDLAHLLRLDGIDDPGEVRRAFVERDHQLSIFLVPAAEPAQREDSSRAAELLR
jgi:uncharacterized membrane protein YcaP (DUF421 family)